MSRTVLVDADVLVWTASTAVEVPTQWDASLWTLHSNLDEGIDKLEAEIADIRSNLDADRVVMCLSDYNDPWRRQIMPSYKSNRKATRKPVIYEPLRQYLHESYETFQRPGLEGDDCLGILLTNPNRIPGEKIIVSIDKDMKTLPGQFLNLKKAREDGAWFPLVSSIHQANYNHLLQSVMGDTTDGYGGCPGIGPKSAEKLLEPFISEEPHSFDVKGAWTAIVAAYSKKNLSEEVALQNARVARICRHSDYDYDNKKVILWIPPK